MKRTDASPKPHSSIAACAAAIDLGVVGEPEVVVRAHVEDLAVAAAHAHPRPLRRRQHALGLLEPGLADLLELRGERRPHRLARHGASLQCRSTFPVSPLRIAANASSNRSAGKRCVMTGEMSRPLCSITVILYQVSYISRP